MSDFLDESSPLIQACPGCGGFLDVSEQEPFAQVHCPSCGTLLRVRTQFRNYTLESIMGVGGMGTVFKALDLNLQRHVALKILRKEFSSSEEDVGKLEREARITAMVNHPHVVKIFSFGSDHGQFYLAMELVEKGSLDDLLELQGQVAELQVLEIGIQVASGLAAAHKIGLIHRDVKPGNILFADAHTTKIVDFGLAIVMEEEAAQRGEIWGTPYYVAPEKLDNRPEDFRSDIYSLGGTLFHALAGRPPYEAQTASLVALKHLKSQPISLQAFAPDVSSETAYVINKTLHKDPEERYQSYAELIEHLAYAKERVAEAAANRNRTRQRVVVESEETQSRVGGVLLAILGVFLLAGLGVWFYRDRLFPGRESPAKAADRQELSEDDAAAIGESEFEKAYNDSVAMIASGDFGSAQSSLESLLKKTGIKEPSLTWLRLNYGLATYLAGDTTAGDEFFASLRGNLADLGGTELNVLKEAIRNCTLNGPTPPDYATLIDTKGLEALSALLFAARNWSMSAYDEAGPFITVFRRGRLPATLAWINEYMPLAKIYQDDHKLLRAVLRAAQSAKTPEEISAASVLAEESAAKVQTTGGLATYLLEYAKRLREDAERSRNEAVQTQAARRASLDMQATEALLPLRPKLTTAFAGLDLKTAETVINELRGNTEIAGSSVVQNLLRIQSWLTRFKADLISHLTKNGLQGMEIKNKTGATIGQSVSSANDSGLQVATNYGITTIPWSDLTPALLTDIALHIASKKTGREANEALWLAGVYAHASGQVDRGKELLLQASQAEDSLKPGLSAFFEVAPLSAKP